MMQKVYLLLLLAVAVHGAKSKTKQPPNVIFILADDLGWNDVSFHGSKQIPTPNLDALACDGIILSNYYVQPICTPTRGALMTGRHPIHTGLQHSVLFSAEKWGLGLNETIMPQYYRKMGYKAHMVGKWHLGFFAEEYTPTYRGFESHIGYYQGMEDYWDHSYSATGLKLDSWGYDFHRDGKVAKEFYGRYSTEIFNDEAIDVIDNHDTEKPLFMYLPFQSVHSGNPITPLEAPWKYLKNFQHIKNKARRNFAGMVSALDDAVGNITKALHERGMLENTIIAFSTDNGGPANGFDFNMANNWPLRGVKESLWEGGVRGTGFIWSPLLEKSGYTSDALMVVEDWLPTLLSGAGYNTHNLPENLDGMDQWSVLSTKRDPIRTDLLHNIDDKERSWALRVQNMKLIWGKGGATQSWQKWYPPVTEEFTMLPYEEGRVEQYKDSNVHVQAEKNAQQDLQSRAHKVDDEVAPKEMFMTDLEQILKSLGREMKGKPFVVKCGDIPTNASTNCQVDKSPCLYDVVKDPCEFYNLADEYPEQVQELLSRMKEYNSTAIPPHSDPVDPAGLPIKHGGLWVPWVKLGPGSDD